MIEYDNIVFRMLCLKFYTVYRYLAQNIHVLHAHATGSNLVHGRFMVYVGSFDGVIYYLAKTYS